MSNSATLTRPVPRASSWQESARPRPPILSQRVIVFGVILVVALALGWLGSRLILSGSPRSVSSVEYVAVVAQLYQQDHDATSARERLAVFGVPTDLVKQAQQASAAGRLFSAGDSAAVETLAVGLTVSSNATASAPVATAGAVTTGAATGVDDPSISGPSDRVAWLGPVLAFIMAFALGIVVLLRTAGLSLSFVKLPRFGGLRPGSRGSGSRGGDGKLWDTSARRRTSVSIAEVRLGDNAPERDEDDPAFVEEEARPRGTALRTRAAPSRVRRAPVYQSTYRLGDDPFDEIHPISDPSNGSLIAACGMTAALKLDSVDVGGYYAFTAWVQDYVNGEELHAAGLIAPGAPDAARGQIEGWVRGGQIDTVLPLERGTTARIGTPELLATITVLDVEFGRDGATADSFVTRLTMRFEVELGEPQAKTKR